MDEKIKDHDVLLVKEPNDEKLKVVAAMDENGKLKAVPPSKTHEQDFMKIDKHSNVLENFFTNLLRQYKDPTHFGFFKGSSENIKSNATTIERSLQNPTQQENKEVLDALRVNPSDHSRQQSQGYQPINPERIHRAQFERVGVTRESLEKTKALDGYAQFSQIALSYPHHPEDG